jgi:1-acyl-sn-glycerol-3-phosphate acyltransferase
MIWISNTFKAIVLILLLLLFGGFAFLISIPAILTGQRWKFLNQVFLIPFGVCARAVVGIRLEALHPERGDLHRPAVCIANHQTGLDLALLGSLCPASTVIVGKKEIESIPFFGWFFKAAGNLTINRSDPIQAKRALSRMASEVRARGLDVAIFPEGTRNTGKHPGLLPFKKGSFHLARELQAPIVPYVCSNLRGIGIWENRELQGGRVIISLLEPVPTTDWTDENMSQKIEEIRLNMSLEFERISALAAKQKTR